MTDTATNNKRIAKNTVFMYIRMLVIMLITLYTSRVLLQALGVVDFGIYNVVGGVITLFMVISGSLSSATQRYITYGLGCNDGEYLNKVFSISLLLHVIISVLIFVLAETLGFYFFEEKMSIPLERIEASVWVFHCAVISLVFMIVGIPFNALIIAKEKMGVYAIISILDAILKLIICYMLQSVQYDRLKFYAVLIVVVQMIVQMCYFVYCKICFKAEINICKVTDFNLVKEISFFSLWSIWGNMAFLSYIQGLNILLNMFFGPVVNAARAIAVQVQSAVNQMVNSFQTALNPQITKSYASGELNYMYSLLYCGSRCSFYLLFAFSFPIFLEAEYFLEIWLIDIPSYTVNFTRIILITTWINSLSNPLITAIKASGKIKNYELVVGGIMLLILPISYLLLKLDFDPYSVFFVHLSFEILAQSMRIYIASKILRFELMNYIKLVVGKVLLVLILSIIIPVLLYLTLDSNALSVWIITIVSILITSCVVIFVGLTKSEQQFLYSKLFKLKIKYSKVIFYRK